VIEPVALRFNFDGQGWTYADNGIASYWQASYSDAELLYAAEALAEARAEERAKIVAKLREMARADKADGHKPEAVAIFEAAHQVERMT